MNKVLVILTTDNGKATIDAGGIDLGTVDGVREARTMARFAESYLADVLINLVANEISKTSAKPDARQSEGDRDPE